MRVFSICLLFIFCRAACAMQPAFPLPAGFVCALAAGPDGAVWAGTEDHGTWRHDPLENKWTQYTTAEGLGEDTTYALVCDRQGRVWAGHGRHGVSVFNGRKWKNYGVTEGPLGERVYGIAVSPLDGDVWIGTNAGLTRYRIGTDDWRHITRAEGLPALGIRHMAFAANGDLFAATECDGLALARVADGYAVWTKVSGIDSALVAPGATELPSGGLNACLAAADGSLWVATLAGLARSTDGGRTWRYRRGADWRKKAQLASIDPGPAPKPGAQLSEDCVTCLAEGPAHEIWAGHPRTGLETLVAGTRLCKKCDTPGADYARAILPLKDGSVLAAWYGHGITEVNSEPPAVITAIAKAAAAAAAPWPRESVAVPVTAAELQAAEKALRAYGAEPNAEPFAVALEDDWTTRGDWVGRYGRYWADPAAIDGYAEFLWGAGEQKIPYRLFPRDNQGCHYIHWLYSDNPNVLELPPVYAFCRVSEGKARWTDARREAECNDWGEYPREYDGPHMYCAAQIPAGTFTLALYFFNKDGHEGPNRVRDYRISVRRRPLGAGERETAGFAQWPELARGRVADFWGGAYKRYVVRGPLDLTIEVNRCYTHLTIVSGLFLDSLDECPPPYFCTEAEYAKKSGALRAEAQSFFRGAAFNPPSGLSAAALALGAHLEYLRAANPRAWADCAREYSALILRALAQAGDADADAQAQRARQCGAALARMGLLERFEEQQRQQGLLPARAMEKALRWTDKDEESWSGSGREYIQRYIREHAGMADWGRPASLDMPNAPPAGAPEDF